VVPRFFPAGLPFRDGALAASEGQTPAQLLLGTPTPVDGLRERLTERSALTPDQFVFILVVECHGQDKKFGHSRRL
jgi:hypothetical protein